MQGRAAGGAVERPAQGLAVDRQNPGPVGPEVVEERLEGAAERLRIEQTKHPADACRGWASRSPGSGTPARAPRGPRRTRRSPRSSPRRRPTPPAQSPGCRAGHAAGHCPAADRGSPRECRSTTPSAPPSEPTAESRSAWKGSPISQMRFPCSFQAHLCWSISATLVAIGNPQRTRRMPAGSGSATMTRPPARAMPSAISSGGGRSQTSSTDCPHVP